MKTYQERWAERLLESLEGGDVNDAVKVVKEILGDDTGGTDLLSMSLAMLADSLLAS